MVVLLSGSFCIWEGFAEMGDDDAGVQVRKSDEVGDEIGKTAGQELLSVFLEMPRPEARYGD